MPISNQADFDNWVTKNTDPYGKACVDVARAAMELLDDPSYDFKDPHKLICDADDKCGAGGITGFMAGAAAQMIAHCHSRGPEFLKLWNGDVQIQDEGERATEKGVALNPALLTIQA